MLGAFNLNEATDLTVHGKLVQWMSEGDRLVELKADSKDIAQEWIIKLQQTKKMAKEADDLVQQLTDALKVVEGDEAAMDMKRAAHVLEDIVERCNVAGIQVCATDG